MIKGAKMYYIMFIVLVIVLFVLGFFWYKQKNMENTNGWEEVILREPRPDEVDPGDIKKECQIMLENYIKSDEFKKRGFKECELVESQSSKDIDECGNVISPQGCAICKIRCHK